MKKLWLSYKLWRMAVKMKVCFIHAEPLGVYGECRSCNMVGHQARHEARMYFEETQRMLCDALKKFRGEK